MRKNLVNLIIGSLLLGFVTLPVIGCGQKTVKVDQAEETGEAVKIEDVGDQEMAAAGAESGAEAGGMDSAVIDEGAGPAESLESQAMDQDGMMAGTVEGSRTSSGFLPVYFDFDKSVIRQDQVERLVANGAILKSDDFLKIQIEGNCDERGTNEYNMALGERRAMSAKKYLVNLGIDAARLNTISYGEERPVNFGHDELSWSQNRRDDFVIVK
jgi:peptidoglycan-associated lipoprotein